MNPRDLELTLAAARAVGTCPPGEEAAWTEQVRARAIPCTPSPTPLGRTFSA
ncbi:hypothetical protein [Streptomyces sp. TP-A0356]|uniref:hypothetical protein n=1 Tax=Streptomyces sp. TP-A0356 TaxID=1359208 RepID=UPI000B0E3277|nr:hypothetical protein [Streptomyces sp. TP-A0356]